MKALLGYAKRYWYLYTIAIVSMIISISLDALAPQITRRIIDHVIVGGQLEKLMPLLWTLLSIGLGRGIFQYSKEFIFDTVGISVGSSLRKSLFSHIQTLSMGFFDGHNTGELMARVKDDVDKIWNMMGFVGMLALECTVHSILMIYCMYRISPALTLVPLAIMPVIAWIAIKMEHGLGSVYEDISEETARLNTVAQENLAGVRTVKAFAREDHEIKKFKSHNQKYYDLNMAQARILAKYQPRVSFLTKCLVMAVIILGGILVIKGKITIGQLGAFTEYSNNIIWPMEMVGWISNDLAAAVASHKKIKKVMETEAEIKDPEMPVLPEKIKGQLVFDHVDFSMGDRQILSDISFRLEEGRTIGIMGMTGSGKSSLVSLIQRFYDINNGQILLDGVDIRRIPLHELRSSVSVVMQDVFLFSDTIIQNIRTGDQEGIDLEVAQTASVSAVAHGFISRLSTEYDTVIGERGVGLSGGQKQRISIARAIAKRAPILILDDSTSALDMETEAQIQQKLDLITDVSKIIIGHRISAVRYADEILILHEGRIVERGTHEQLMTKKGEYYKTYQVQYGEAEVGPCL